MTMGPLRQVARIVVLDAEGSVLLVRYQDVQPMDPERVGPLTYWVPPGGGLNPSESYESAAARELEEETGLTPEIGPLLWERRHVLQYKERLVSQHERYFLARLGSIRPAVANRTSEAILEHRWWTVPDLCRSSDQFFPVGFVELLQPIVQGQLPSGPLRI
jgi:8-oxo-dGTP pyrophosphatase MutT (NUDIX family)